MARRAAMMLWDALLMVTWCLHNTMILSKVVHSANVTTCRFPAVYGFGDSVVDVGNAIAAFPNQFANAEVNPNGIFWPAHSADRICDGKLLIDNVGIWQLLGTHIPVPQKHCHKSAVGDQLRSCWRNSEESDRRLGARFRLQHPVLTQCPVAMAPWYKVRLDMYYQQTYVNQSLPTYESLNTSIYMVQAGFQDYFFPLYDMKATTKSLLSNVPEVVSAISDLLKGLAIFGATQVLVVNMPPLGCFPALLTLYPASIDKYDLYGCLTNHNKISVAHNEALEEEVIALRATYPNTTYYLGDFYSVYTDILKTPQAYNITETLKACCGEGGSYNFNKDVTCSETGRVGNEAVNLTTATCLNSRAFLSWDGIHPSHAANRAAAAAFFSGKHITPSNIGCVANTSLWNSSS